MKDDYNLDFRNGDFHVADADNQHIELIIRSNKGNWLNNPLTGAGIDRYLNGNLSASNAERDIRLDLENDGFSISGLSVKGSIIDINAIRLEE